VKSKLFLKIFTKELFNGNGIIPRTLYNLRSEKKLTKLFYFLLLSIVSHSEILFGFPGRSHFIFMYFVELYQKLLEKLLEKSSKYTLIIIKVTCVIIKGTGV
jgi:hypothetical protein